MNKKILTDYIDACELIKETEEDIRKLRKREIVHDKVTGSNPEFPYQSKSFQVSGEIEYKIQGKQIEKENELLQKRKENARKIKVQAEEILNMAPARMQRIIRFKIFERKTWDEVAVQLGGKCTGESIRKEYQRFLEEK